MMTPTRTRTPILAFAAIALGLLVVGGILLVGRLGVPEGTPAPTSLASPSLSASATDPLSTPEGAVRAFFAALADARRTDDRRRCPPLVTGRDSSAYLSAAGVLAGQKAANKASVLTIQQLDTSGSRRPATRQRSGSRYTEGGYDISLDSGQPLESPGTLAPRDVTVELRQVDGHWLVDSYEAQVQ